MTIKEFKIQLALGTLTHKIKWKLARNKRTSKKILTILSTDKEWGVRCGVADNPNTPIEVSTKLLEDENMWVRDKVAYNLNTSKEIFDGNNKDI